MEGLPWGHSYFLDYYVALVNRNCLKFCFLKLYQVFCLVLKIIVTFKIQIALSEKIHRHISFVLLWYIPFWILCGLFFLQSSDRKYLGG